MNGPPPVPRLTTARLVLTPPGAADRAAIATLAGDLDVSRWLGRVPHPYTLADADEFLAHVAPRELCLAVRLADAAPLMGIVGVAGTQAGWELGYWLGRPHWGMGFATEAARAVLERAAAIAPRPPLVSGYFDGNHRSAAVLGKLGFVETGQTRVPCRALGHEVVRIDMTYAGDRPC